MQEMQSPSIKSSSLLESEYDLQNKLASCGQREVIYTLVWSQTEDKVVVHLIDQLNQRDAVVHENVYLSDSVSLQGATFTLSSVLLSVCINLNSTC